MEERNQNFSGNQKAKALSGSLFVVFIKIALVLPREEN